MRHDERGVDSTSMSNSSKSHRFDFTELLEIADHLEAVSGEAALRSAINRAYYAVYHQAKNYAMARRLVTQNRPSHETLWLSFINDPDKAIRVRSEGAGVDAFPRGG